MLKEATGSDFLGERGNIITERLLWVGGKKPGVHALAHLPESLRKKKCVWEGRGRVYSHLHQSIFSIGAPAPSLTNHMTVII